MTYCLRVRLTKFKKTQNILWKKLAGNAKNMTSLPPFADTLNLGPNKKHLPTHSYKRDTRNWPIPP